MPKRNHSHTRPICKEAKRAIFSDRISAQLALEDIQLFARRTIHDESRIYPCRFGNHWHLTSEKEQRTERRVCHSS
jgi:hypothetical protein